METKTFYTIFKKDWTWKPDGIAGIAYKHSRCYDGLYPTKESAQNIIDCYNNPAYDLTELYVSEVIVRVDFKETV